VAIGAMYKPSPALGLRDGTGVRMKLFPPVGEKLNLCLGVFLEFVHGSMPWKDIILTLGKQNNEI